MPDVNNAAVETSAQPTQETQQKPQEIINGMTRDQRHEWQLTGKLPEKPKSADSASADPLKEAKPEGKPESAAESGAAKHSQEKTSKPKLNAEERIQQLEATIAKIRQQSGEKPAEKSAEAAAAKPRETKPPEKLEAPKEPSLEEFQNQGKTWEDYEAAVKKFNRDMAAYEARKAVEDFKQQQATELAQREFNKQLVETAERYPDLKDVIAPLATELGEVDPNVRYFLDRSRMLPDLFYVIGKNAEDRKAFIEEAKSDPETAIRRIIVTEYLIAEELSKPKTELKDASRKENGQFQSPEKKITSAPRPPAEVSGTATVEDDAVKTALAKRDFSAYKREMNRREMARK